jgi:hypothetical protein
MTRRVETVNSKVSVFSPDDPQPLGQRFWAVVRAKVIDELTGQPPLSAITIESDALHLVPRVASDGLVGLVGIPQQVFPALASQKYDLMLKVKARGYIPRKTSFSILQDTNFPSNFIPPQPTDLALHREPTVIAGRVVRASGNTTKPLSGAVVKVTGIWRKPPPANLVIASGPPNLVSLHPRLYSDRGGAIAGQLERRNLPLILGDDKFLLDDVSEDANSVRLSNRQNLNLGNILLIDSDKPDIAEYITIKTIAGAGTVTQPAVIMLDHPLLHAHRKNARVQKANPQSLGPQKQLTQEALAGDICVFLNNVSGLTTGNQVKISGGPNAAEYHRVSLFSTISDAEGYYRLPPLSRIAQLKIRAQHGSLTPVQMEFRPDYSLHENRLDFIFQ